MAQTHTSNLLLQILKLLAVLTLKALALVLAFALKVVGFIAEKLSEIIQQMVTNEKKH